MQNFSCIFCRTLENGCKVVLSWLFTVLLFIVNSEMFFSRFKLWAKSGHWSFMELAYEFVKTFMVILADFRFRENYEKRC